MKLTDKQLDLTAAYVKSELSGEALTDFETALAVNDTLREEVEFQRNLLSALRLDAALDILQQINDKDKNETSDTKPKNLPKDIQQVPIVSINRKRHFSRWLYGVAVAACLLLVGIVGLNAYNHHQLDSDMEAATKIEYPKTVSARNEMIDKRMAEAEQAFHDKDWERIKNIFSYLRDTLMHNSNQMDFYDAVILYNEKKYMESVEKLESIDLDEAELACEIRHFLTLSYLKIKDKAKARAQYKILTNESEKCNKRTIRRLRKYFIL